jgi:hypothetical protein
MADQPTMKLARCPSCDGYGWFEDELEGGTSDCDWCGGIGYVYRDANAVDHKIPEADYGRIADALEQLDTQRLHEMGYTGEAKHPSQQPIRFQQDDGDDAPDEA